MPTFVHGKGSKIFKDGFNLSCYLSSLEASYTCDTSETTTLCNNSKTFILGKDTTTISGSGFFDGTVGAVDDVLEDALKDATNIWTCFPSGDTRGNAGWGLTGIHTEYSLVSTIDDAVKISVSGQGNTLKERLISLMADTLVSSTTSTTAVDNLVQTTAGGTAYVQVESVTGTVEIDIEDSADNINFASIKTFTINTDLSAQRLEIAGTIRRYCRATITIGGGEDFKGQIALCRL